ncbi:hypothetical protein GA0061102_102754 [Rhizobium miluonense]|uniref:Uncharacterized protein n=1 Tax=Rhizobium miluonense TaxID=411945 RepID=A0A1C3WD51_9HYPH|nr:hypothetical protein GA0061102_102754 [Rhizobium miluonense]
MMKTGELQEHTMRLEKTLDEAVPFRRTLAVQLQLTQEQK